MRWLPQPRNRACPSGTIRGSETAVGAALCGRPFPVAGRFPPSRRGGLAPPAGFRNFSGQRWNFVLRVGAPYGHHGHRRAGGSGDPPLRGNFGPERCDGHRSHGTAPVPPEPNGAVKNAVGAALCGRPSPVAGHFPSSRRGGACPSRRFSEFFGQRWVLRPLRRRALRASWSTKGGRVRRPAPTGQFRS